MLVVKVELWSAIDGRHTELARMHIANDGQSDNANFSDYNVATLRGRDAAAFVVPVYQRKGRVLHHARLAQHVWNLVAKALTALEYGK